MLDFLGVTENWSAIENIPWTQRWTFSDDSTSDPVSLDGVTFTGKIYISQQRTPIDLDIQKSTSAEEANILIVSCIGLPEGRHPYEIFSISESGNQNRLISGYIGVIKSIDKLVDQLKTYASRTLSIRLPGHVTRQIRLEWLSCTLAASSAQQAWEYYEQTKKKAEEMQETAQKAEQAVEKLEHLDDKLATLDQGIKDAQDAAAEAEKWAKDASRKGDDGLTPYIGPNGNWWTGEGYEAHDTGIRAVPIDGTNGKDGQNGEPGKTPIIQYYSGQIGGIPCNGNYWYVWGINPDTGKEEYTFTGILAEGKNGTPGHDGLDADSIKRLYLDTIDDLPRPGNHGTICYIPKTLPIKATAATGWLRVGDYAPGTDTTLTIGNTSITLTKQDVFPENWVEKINQAQTCVLAEAGAPDITAGQKEIEIEKPTTTILPSGGSNTRTINFTALVKGTVGNTITLATNNIELSGPTLTGGTDPIDATYDIYCWLLKPDGTTDWIPVNQDNHDYTQYAHTNLGNITVAADNYETDYPDGYYPKLSWVKRAIAAAAQNTIAQIIRAATANLLGMVKLGTANPLDPATSAPVGANPNGQLMLERARWDQYGSVKFSWREPIPDAHFPGPIGLNPLGQLVTHEATITTPGVIKINNTKNVEEGAHVRTTKDNLAIVPLAGYVSYGAVCFGTAYDITINDAPHIVTIPKCNGDATYNQHAGNVKNSIIFNLSQQGVLKYDGSGPNGTNNGNSLYLSHDNTLTISGGSITVTRYPDIIFHDTYATAAKGGAVKIGPTLAISANGTADINFGTMNDTAKTVPGKTIAQWIEAKNYISISALDARDYITRTQHNNDIQTRVECVGGIKKLSYISEEQYANLATKDASTLYLLY